MRCAMCDVSWEGASQERVSVCNVISVSEGARERESELATGKKMAGW